MLDQGADPNFLDENGLTPLHVAARQQPCPTSLEMLKLLTYFGCPVERRDTRGRLALHVACQTSVEFVQVLLDAGTPINTVDTSCCTPLMLASSQSTPERRDIVQFLLNHGADVYQRDINGKTALHYVCENNGANQDTGSRNDTVTSLLRAGLSVNARDNNNRTPFICELTDVLSLDSSQYNREQHLLVLRTLIQGGASLDSTCQRAFTQTLVNSTNALERCAEILKMLAPVSSINQLRQYVLVKSTHLQNSVFERVAARFRTSVLTVPSLVTISRNAVRACLHGEVLYRTRFLDLPKELEQVVMYSECLGS